MGELKCPCCNSRLINYETTGRVLSCTWTYCHFRCNASDLQRLVAAKEFWEMNMLSDVVEKDGFALT